MSAGEGFTRRWRVGRFWCELTMPKPERGQVAFVACEWSPHVPDKLTAAEQRQYEAGRDAAMAEYVATLLTPPDEAAPRTLQ